MTDINFTLINLGDLSKPAQKLVTSISSAIGILYEPTRIRRKAHAEADAALVLAKNREEISGFELRATNRALHKEVRRQENIESIVRHAVDELPDSVADETVDEDWIYQFFEQCQDVKDEQMQSLWARILAGEVSQPGSFSLRTLGLVKTLEKGEAELITILNTFVWQETSWRHSIVYRETFGFMQELGLTTGDFVHLENIGIILTRDNIDLTVKDSTLANSDDDRVLTMWYFDRPHQFKFQCASTGLEVGKTFFTQIGQQLSTIAGGVPHEGYRLSAIEHLAERGFQLLPSDGE